MQTDDKELKEFLNNEFNTISINYTDLVIANDSTFFDLQNGYRYHPETKENLTGTGKGDWQDDWFVVGYLSGDPLIYNKKERKVYSALHGEGEWKPFLVNQNLQSLKATLTALKELSKNRENPVQYKNNPLSREDTSKYVLLLRDENADIRFWCQLVQ